MRIFEYFLAHKGPSPSDELMSYQKIKEKNIDFDTRYYCFRHLEGRIEESESVLFMSNVRIL